MAEFTRRYVIVEYDGTNGAEFVDAYNAYWVASQAGYTTVIVSETSGTLSLGFVDEFQNMAGGMVVNTGDMISPTEGKISPDLLAYMYTELPG